MKILNKKLLGYPLYGYLTGILLYFLQNRLYELIRIYQEKVSIHWHCTKIPLIDNAIPLQPQFWILIYILSHVFWIITPIVASSTDKSHYFDFVFGTVIAEVIGAIIFIIYPTGMDRAAEGLLNNNPGIWNRMLQFVYAEDGYNIASNLFPSFHCLISTSCFLAVYKHPEVSKRYQIFCFIFCLLIFISTVMVKQHYFIDIPAGILLSCMSYVFTVKCKFGKTIVNLSDKKTDTAG